MLLSELLEKINKEVTSGDIILQSALILRNNIDDRLKDNKGVANGKEITLPDWSSRAGYYGKRGSYQKKYYAGGYKEFKEKVYGKDSKLFYSGDLLASLTVSRINQNTSRLAIIGNENQEKAVKLEKKGYKFFGYNTEDIKDIENFITKEIQNIIGG